MTGWPAGGPVAFEWLRLSAQGAVRDIWPLTDPDLQLVMVQAFLWANRTHDFFGNPNHAELEQFAAQLIEGPSTSVLWRAFEETQARELREAFADVDFDDLGIATYDRPIGVDLELIVFAPASENPSVLEEGQLIRTVRQFVVRHHPSGWLVRSTTEKVVEPGWPPGIPGDGNDS